MRRREFITLLLGGRPVEVVKVALADKMACIACAVLPAKDGIYRPPQLVAAI
jgi:hypothetical protein